MIVFYMIVSAGDGCYLLVNLGDPTSQLGGWVGSVRLGSVLNSLTNTGDFNSPRP